MERPSDKVRRFVAAGQYKDALKIAKDFRLGISKSDSECMKRGYECIVHPRFYESLGFDLNTEINKAIDTICRLYS